MSPTMWAVVLTNIDGTIQASQCFSVENAKDAQKEARFTYQDWKDALMQGGVTSII